MRIALWVVMAGLLAGCSTSKRITLPDGDQGFLVSCDTGSQDLGDCYNKASGLCHGPYEVIDRTQGAQVNFSANPYTQAGGAMPKRDMVIQCRG
ncbi:MAG: hypothetical protein ABWX83_00690 [Luteibacter sp.]